MTFHNTHFSKILRLATFLAGISSSALYASDLKQEPQEGSSSSSAGYIKPYHDEKSPELLQIGPLAYNAQTGTFEGDFFLEAGHIFSQLGGHFLEQKKLYIEEKSATQNAPSSEKVEDLHEQALVRAAIKSLEEKIKKCNKNFKYMNEAFNIFQRIFKIEMYHPGSFVINENSIWFSQEIHKKKYKTVQLYSLSPSSLAGITEKDIKKINSLLSFLNDYASSTAVTNSEIIESYHVYKKGMKLIQKPEINLVFSAFMGIIFSSNPRPIGGDEFQGMLTTFLKKKSAEDILKREAILKNELEPIHEFHTSFVKTLNAFTKAVKETPDLKKNIQEMTPFSTKGKERENVEAQ